jgi:hypothetical protein
VYGSILPCIEGFIASLVGSFNNLMGYSFGTHAYHDAARELGVIGQQYPFEMPVFKRLRLTFPEGIKMLQENGYPDVSDACVTA